MGVSPACPSLATTRASLARSLMALHGRSDQRARHFARVPRSDRAVGPLEGPALVKSGTVG